VLVILMKMTTSNPARKSVLLEACPGLDLTEDSRNTASGCKTAQSARG